MIDFDFDANNFDGMHKGKSTFKENKINMSNSTQEVGMFPFFYETGNGPATTNTLSDSKSLTL